MTDIGISAMLAIAKRNFKDADIVYSAAKDTIFVIDNGVQIGELSSGNLKINEELWNGTTSLQQVSDNIENEKPPNFKDLYPYDSKFKFGKDTTWKHALYSNIDPRKHKKAGSFSNVEVLLEMKRVLKKKKIKHSSICTLKEYAELHLKSRSNMAARKWQSKANSEDNTKTFKIDSKVIDSLKDSYDQEPTEKSGMTYEEALKPRF
tara:strand:- start:2049 stop:2666 length:618 start_codon:yes stop_codon:yes gene_type:complete